MRPTVLDFSNLAAVRRWLDRVQESTDDVLAVAHDQTRPVAQRDLGRAQAVRILKDAAETVTNLLLFARRGLSLQDRAPTPTPEPPRKDS